jgi:hypothetical protein
VDSFLGFSDRLSFKFNLVTVVQQAVQDGISDGGFTDDVVPVFDRARGSPSEGSHRDHQSDFE